MGSAPGRAAGASTQHASAAGIVLGTVGYMAPEQVRGERTDWRADVFSFGTVLYELLSGRRAFHGATSVETLNAILKAEPPPLAETHPGLPAAGVRAVERCLAKDPARRFQSAADLAFALESGALPTSSASMAALAGQDHPHRARFGLLGRPIGARLATALVIATAGTGFWFRARTLHAPDAPAPRFQLDLGADSGAHGGSDTQFRPIISPEGGRVAFTREGKLWLRDLDRLAARIRGHRGRDRPLLVAWRLRELAARIPEMRTGEIKGYEDFRIEDLRIWEFERRQTPSLRSAASGQPFHSLTNTLP